MMHFREKLLQKIATREATIGVVGLGYVGLPLAVEFARAGFSVIGLDVQADKVQEIMAGRSYIKDVPCEHVQGLVAQGKLRATSDYAALGDADAISICVPTPLRKTRDPDMSFILQAARSIADICRAGTLIVLESTTYPGTTEEVLLPVISAGRLTVGQDMFLAYSPERIDPGNRDFTVSNTPKIVGGMTEACSEIVAALYGSIVKQVISVRSPKTAEMVKLLENTFRAVNIGLVNEMALMCDRLGIDVWEVIQAAATKPFGYMPFYPGPGLGGHCIPVDPLYLSWKLKTINYTARFIELASEINAAMPEYVVGKIVQALNDRERSVRGSHVLLLGVAYKADVSDLRESPALDILSLLHLRGAQLSYHDPHVPKVQLNEDMSLCSSPLDQDLLAAADCVVVVTDHSQFDWDEVAAHSRIIVDTRHVYRKPDGRFIIGL